MSIPEDRARLFNGTVAVAKELVMMELSVTAESINASDMRCPQCSSRTFVSFGFSTMARKEVWENGVSVSFEIDPTTHVFEPDLIVCLHCQTQTRIKAGELSRLERQVSDLRQQILDMSGEDPMKLGVPH